ncbi:MAG TPA: heavy metal-binding domain-containing protein [Acidimicrobiales bacterium]|nr:heavy metal-binding domain-containing protein [Acidimicrobiales bacterium]
MTDAESRRREIREAVRRLAGGGYLTEVPARRGVTSDLTIDESLILHSIGWEPVELVCGVSAYSIPVGYWNWGSGEVTPASDAWQRAVGSAGQKLQSECQNVLGHGVVGVQVEVSVERHLVNAVLVGTAVAPVAARRAPSRPFISDLSCRDFALLHQAGWDPIGLAFGASFVNAPRRGATTALRQSTQNVELTNFTEALYSAREAAMERMQRTADQLGGQGVVAVQVSEGPMEFARHAIRFTAWGTAVRRSERPPSLGRPRIVVSLDDDELAFEAMSLRAAK